MKRQHHGFTLMEMIAVIGIISMLTFMAAPVIERQALKAREAQLKQQLRTVRMALDRCFANTGVYPDPATLHQVSAPANGWVPDIQGGSGWAFVSINPARWRGPYLARPIGQPVLTGGTPVGLTTLTGGWGWNGNAMQAKHAFFFNSSRISTEGTPYDTW